MGLGDDEHRQMLDAAVEGAGGEVLVHARGYWERRTGDLLINDASSVVETLSTVPEIRAALPRVLVSGLLSTARGNRPVQLMGVDPAREVALRDISEHVVEGSRLEDATVRSPVLLGRPVAKELEVKPGDRIVLTASGPDGELARALFHVAGIIQSGRADLDETVAYTTIDAAREALGIGDQLTQVGLLTRSGVDVDAARAAVLQALGERARELEVLTWRTALPEMVGFIQIDNAFLYVYGVIIYLVVIFAIANTFLVAVMERIRELGLLNALGLRGSRIARLILAETTLLTGVSMIVGLVLALGIHLALARWGVPVALFGVDNMDLSGVDISNMVMRSEIVPFKWLVASGLVAVSTVASAVYPALRAARLAPAEAMRFYE
jgi:ABC-type lipoprotein release transport system permease subunit